MRSIEGQRSDNAPIKRNAQQKERQLRELKDQLAGLKSHASPILRTSIETKIAALEEELKERAARPPRRD